VRREVAALFLYLYLLLLAGPARCQSALRAKLTLAEAESVAIGNQPRIVAARLRARASLQRVRQAKAGFQPTVGFNSTGVQVADPGTSIAAGAITTSSISDRFAYGGYLVQMITDFGRTSALVASQRFLSEAEESRATFTGAQIRLNVRRAYFQVMEAEAVLRAAKEAQANRQLISRQIAALAQSELRSTLDVNFAAVLESEAELAVVRAETSVEQWRTYLASAMGQTRPVTALLIDDSPPAALPADVTQVVTEALTRRADLSVAAAREVAAERFASAEKRLSYPTLTAIAAAGEIPYHDRTLHDDYAGTGFNLNIPVFNGGLFAARRSEAELEAQARKKDVEETELEVNEQVRASWYEANAAYRSLDVSARLVSQSREALRLARARYDSGLGSIVELNEALLSETSAEITAATTNYEYLIRRAELDYAAGLLN
jgi:outer membrane protein